MRANDATLGHEQKILAGMCLRSSARKRSFRAIQRANNLVGAGLYKTRPVRNRGYSARVTYPVKMWSDDLNIRLTRKNVISRRRTHFQE